VVVIVEVSEVVEVMVDESDVDVVIGPAVSDEEVVVVELGPAVPDSDEVVDGHGQGLPSSSVQVSSGGGAEAVVEEVEVDDTGLSVDETGLSDTEEVLGETGLEGLVVDEEEEIRLVEEEVLEVMVSDVVVLDSLEVVELSGVGE
jgi:hypothetical protein